MQKLALFLLLTVFSTSIAMADETLERLVAAKQDALNVELAELTDLKKKLSDGRAAIESASNWEEFARARWITGLSLVGVSLFSPLVMAYRSDEPWTTKRKLKAILPMILSTALALEGMYTEYEWREVRIPELYRLLTAAILEAKTLEAQIKKDMAQLEDLKKQLKENK